MAIDYALTMSTEYILVDEVTSALQPMLVREVLDTPRMLSRAWMSMICVTREIRFPRDVSDRLALFKDELIHKIGSQDQVIGNPQRAQTASFRASVD
ncbi:P-loop NTPase family protein [Caballeronia grimmiae]